MSDYLISNGNECPSCAGELYFDVRRSMIACSHCGYEKVDEAYENKKLEFNSKLKGEEPDLETNDVLICENCAAEIIIKDKLKTVRVCPYCESTHTNVLANNRSVKPSGIVPFVITKEKANQMYKDWVKSLRKAKRAFKKFVQNNNHIHLVKTYRPFWVFDATVDADYVLLVSQPEMNGHRFPTQRTEEHRGNLKSWFRDVAIDGTYKHHDLTKVDKDRSDFENFELDFLVKFDKTYLTGTESQLYTIDLDDAFEYTDPYVGLLIRQETFHKVPGLHKQLKDFSLIHSDTTYIHVLMPVWEARIVFEDKEYTFSINGQTGKVYGEYPRNMFFKHENKGE